MLRETAEMMEFETMAEDGDDPPPVPPPSIPSLLDGAMDGMDDSESGDEWRDGPPAPPQSDRPVPPGWDVIRATGTDQVTPSPPSYALGLLSANDLWSGRCFTSTR